MKENKKLNSTPSETATPFWRMITTENVKAAIQGSFLNTICEAFAKNYTPKAPLPLVLLQVVTLMSCALTHKKTEREDAELVQAHLWDDDVDEYSDHPAAR